MSKPDKMSKVQAMRALLAWADSNETAQALDALEILDLSDEEVEALFRPGRSVVRVPHLGKVT